MIPVEQIGRAVMQRAELTWEAAGHVYPCLWAVGESESVFAVPLTVDAARISVEAKLAMHAMFAADIKATFIGVVNEIWTRLGDPSEQLTPGELEREADTNPDVHTGILVQALDMLDFHRVLVLSRMELNAAGEIRWEVSTPKTVRNVLEVQLDTVARLAAGLSTVEAAEKVAERADWYAVRVES